MGVGKPRWRGGVGDTAAQEHTERAGFSPTLLMSKELTTDLQPAPSAKTQISLTHPLNAW